MYKVIGVDGQEYGPVTEETLREWLAQNRLNLGSKVKVEGAAGWQRLGDLPQFASAAAPGNPPIAAAPQVAARTSGLAIASLVLGALGVLTAGIAAIPGLILGIVALLKIKNSQGRLQGMGIAIAGTALSAAFMLIVPIMAALLLPALAKAKTKAQSVQCLNNVKQLNLAFMMYADDHQGQFPSAENWCDLVKPYLGSQAPFHCNAQPEGRCSYSFNANLSNRRVSDVPKPAETILVFSSEDGWNQSGGSTALKTHRHGNVFTYGCTDGHAEVRRPGIQSLLKWDVPAQPDR